MTAVYLAARYGRREELCRYADDLRARGHTITSRWISGAHHHVYSAAMERGPSVEEQRAWAEEDWADLSSAGVCIAFTEDPSAAASGRARGGRHVELGLALAWGKRVVVVGPGRENVFCCLDQVDYFETWTDAIAAIDAEMRWAENVTGGDAAEAEGAAGS